MLAEIRSFMDKKQDTNVLFVLKGFSLNSFEVDMPALKNIVGNKIAWLLQLTQREQKIVCFDEFVCLYDMMISQFAKIYIIENPLYRNFYPLSVALDDHVVSALVEYFDEDSEASSYIEGFDEYTNVYSNFVVTANGVACCYNLTENHFIDSKIEIYIADVQLKPVEEGTIDSKACVRLNLCNETDYFDFVQQLYQTDNDFCITWESYILGKKIIENNIYKANTFFPNRICKTTTGKNDVFDITEIKKTMKKYWGYDEFRDIKIYDLDSVSRKQKETRLISQGEIIGNLVHQCIGVNDR